MTPDIQSQKEKETFFMLGIFRRFGILKGNREALQPATDGHNPRIRYGTEVRAQVIRGRFPDAIKFVRDHAAVNEVISHSIRMLPMTTDEKRAIERGQQDVCRWVVVILCRYPLRTNENIPVANSAMPEAMEDANLDSLVARINKRITGHEVCDIQLLRDDATGGWLASISFPYSLTLERIVG